MASLDHPNIVRLYDFVEVEGHLVLVMERLFGGTVNSQGPLPPQTACAYVVAACAGLQYAHERGILHRDVKPQNLLLSAEGTLESRRLRDREAAQRQGHDAARHGSGHAVVHRARADQRGHAHARGRRLRGGRRAVRAALGRRAAVPAAGQPGGGVPAAHQARARAAARARAVPANRTDRDHRARSAPRSGRAVRLRSGAGGRDRTSGRRGVARPTAPRPHAACRRADADRHRHRRRPARAGPRTRGADRHGRCGARGPRRGRAAPGPGGDRQVAPARSGRAGGTTGRGADAAGPRRRDGTRLPVRRRAPAPRA